MPKGYTVTETIIHSGSAPIKLLILKPEGNRFPKEKTAGILWIHGGGYVTGMPEMVHFSRAAALVKKYGAVVVSPGYRLACKSPYPAALLDCFSALCYLNNHAQELGVNPSLLMVGGESAGGGLTAALCMYARDKSDIGIAFQMPLYPMLDDRDTPSSKRNFHLPWNTFFNRRAWKRYLSNAPCPPPSYAAPARETDYSSLPPMYTFVGSKEPFYSETLDYAENLRKAGVKAEADVYPTGFHAFDMLLPFRKISKKAAQTFEEHFLKALDNASGKQPPG